MPHQSVDALQQTLADTVFSYAVDRRKAAGRALGTLVELVTYYTLRSWDLRDHIIIERAIPEFGNPDIVHNVEFSLHPIAKRYSAALTQISMPITAAKVIRGIKGFDPSVLRKVNQLVSGENVKRNACIIAEDNLGPVVANIDELGRTSCVISVAHLFRVPFAIFECKRVGIEEGMSKGPQTIEKAKQGAYVARSVSALQKVRMRNGHFYGVLERRDHTLYTKQYEKLLREVIESEAPDLLSDFILTVGVVSNHGNWFTSQNPNKELRVLAQSYDWLLFLTDAGLSQFIDKLLLNPTPELSPARHAFLASYSGKSGLNKFTKVRIDIDADKALRRYFILHEGEVETWFNIISPATGTVEGLRKDVKKLASKNWERIRKQ